MSVLKMYQNGPRTLVSKTRAVSRSMTASTALVKLPLGARIIGFVLTGTGALTPSTATISVGNTSASANEYVNAVSVLTTAGDGSQWLKGVAGAVGQAPLQNDTTIWVKYAETGTPSTVGAWNLTVVFTTGEFVK